MTQRGTLQNLTVHISLDAMQQLKEAAAIRNEDLATFVASSALESARSILADEEWSG